MSDEGFHEIQLNGKQLVFLFMFATVVLVGTFLCGVMVGRGVRAERGDQTAQTTDAPAATPAPPPATPPASAPATPAPAGKGQSPAPPEPAEDDYYKSLTAQKPADESLKAPSKPKPAPAGAVPESKPAPSSAAAARPADPPPAAEKSKPAPAPVADQSQPAGVTSGGFAVQITALRDRGEADAIVKRLVTKGYPAYVLNPVPGKAPVYRVQVGRYKNRGDADRIAGRLKKEEQFSPWVTR
jgi:DedD protein